jgi:hypothetical protein
MHMAQMRASTAPGLPDSWGRRVGPDGNRPRSIAIRS